MLETSRDLLNLLLGLSVTIVAVMFAWVLFEVARSIKNVNDIMARVKGIVAAVEESVQIMKSKSSQAAAYINLAIKGGQEILKHINQNKNKSRRNRKDTEK